MNFIKIKGDNQEEYFVNLDNVLFIRFHGFNSETQCYEIVIKSQHNHDIFLNIKDEREYLRVKNEFMNFYRNELIEEEEPSEKEASDFLDCCLEISLNDEDKVYEDNLYKKYREWRKNKIDNEEIATNSIGFSLPHLISKLKEMHPIEEFNECRFGKSKYFITGVKIK